MNIHGLDSFRRFQEEGLAELLQEISPIEDFSGKFALHLLNYEFHPSEHKEDECRELNISYSSLLTLKVRLEIKDTGEIKEQNIFIGGFPLMTSKGTFIINGIERVVVSQLIRSPGIYFILEPDIASGRELCLAKLIPYHGAWLDFETNPRGIISVKINGKQENSGAE